MVEDMDWENSLELLEFVNGNMKIYASQNKKIFRLDQLTERFQMIIGDIGVKLGVGLGRKLTKGVLFKF